jgi:hypothetical protein
VAGLGRRWWQRGGQQGSRQAGKSVRLSRRVRGGQTEVAEKVLGDALRRRLLAGLLVLVGQWRVGGAPSPNPLPRGEGEDLFATLRGRGWCACGRCRPWRLGGGTGRRCRRSAWDWRNAGDRGVVQVQQLPAGGSRSWSSLSRRIWCSRRLAPRRCGRRRMGSGRRRIWIGFCWGGSWCLRLGARRWMLG